MNTTLTSFMIIGCVLILFGYEIYDTIEAYKRTKFQGLKKETTFTWLLLSPSEEVVYRLFLLGLLLNHFNPFVALLFAAVIFAIVHALVGFKKYGIAHIPMHVISGLKYGFIFLIAFNLAPDTVYSIEIANSNIIIWTLVAMLVIGTIGWTALSGWIQLIATILIIVNFESWSIPLLVALISVSLLHITHNICTDIRLYDKNNPQKKKRKYFSRALNKSLK